MKHRCNGLAPALFLIGLLSGGCAGPAARLADSGFRRSHPVTRDVVPPRIASADVHDVTEILPVKQTPASQPRLSLTRLPPSSALDAVQRVVAEGAPIVPAQAVFFWEDELSLLDDAIEAPAESKDLRAERDDVDASDAVDATDQAEIEKLARRLQWAGDYQIETGDSLEIKFRVLKEMNDVVTVRPDGMISLQIVGDQPAAGLTPEQLRQQLELAYSQDVVTPDLAVIVRSFSGNSIYVGGEVNNPVRVPLTGRITTLKAVILAGGFKDTADKKRVVLRREDGSCCRYDLKSVIECTSPGRDVELRPYDIVYVPKSRIAKINLFVEQYIDKVLPFSRSFGVFISHNTGLTGGGLP